MSQTPAAGVSQVLYLSESGCLEAGSRCSGLHGEGSAARLHPAWNTFPVAPWLPGTRCCCGSTGRSSSLASPGSSPSSPPAMFLGETALPFGCTFCELAPLRGGRAGCACSTVLSSGLSVILVFVYWELLLIVYVFSVLYLFAFQFYFLGDFLNFYLPVLR